MSKVYLHRLGFICPGSVWEISTSSSEAGNEMCGGMKHREEIRAWVSEYCTSQFSLEGMKKNSEKIG